MKTILVTGGAGFIGSALIRNLIINTNYNIINVDSLTYAGNLESIPSNIISEKYHFIKCDICENELVSNIFNKYKPNLVFHLAAESHVDRSIDSPEIFLKTNILGTYNLLNASRGLLDQQKKEFPFRFHHISTDEVYGDLLDEESLFNENTPYSPSSPYSASKASSDHIVRAWGRTYGIPYSISNCSNNYGPYQFPEKLIPHMIINALEGRKLPIYGDGTQIRDWLYIDDHIRAMYKVATSSRVGETYNIGGHNEITNIEIVKRICKILDEKITNKPAGISTFGNLIEFVKDRPGHDKRYAIDSSKIKKELEWSPIETFETGLKKTVLWYLKNKSWWKNIISGEYKLKRIGNSKL